MESEEGAGTHKKVVVMRGLPSCGKSYRAKELAGDKGLILSTDQYWYTVNRPNKPDEYSFYRPLIGEAHKWNVLRFQQAVNMGKPFLIVDNVNLQWTDFCCDYARYAFWQDYDISIEEPTSDWWLEIKELLKDKKANRPALKRWSKKLTKYSENNHAVPENIIDKMMRLWQNDLLPKVVVENCIQQHDLDL